ncbi:MAG TPA: DUF4349 domain-containing protein, partial [Labilithrix sp.]|nr:DUF4349 domain-containing protein [Labilithrix sp.]
MMTIARRVRPARRLPILVLLLATMTQTGCAAGSVRNARALEHAAPPPAQAAPLSGGAVARAAEPPAPSSAPAPASAASAKARSAGPTTRTAVIIYQGDLRMAAVEEEIPKIIDRIIDVAESLGGRIGGRKDQSVQIKVPSASFREAMTKVEGIGDVLNRSVTADDVSEEFQDLEVRLANLRATRSRLQEFMTRAAGIQDMLTVERELERVAQEIDRIEGRLEFLRTRASMSVISV